MWVTSLPSEAIRSNIQLWSMEKQLGQIHPLKQVKEGGVEGICLGISASTVASC
jgi:hypothetical protein